MEERFTQDDERWEQVNLNFDLQYREFRIHKPPVSCLPVSVSFFFIFFFACSSLTFPFHFGPLAAHALAGVLLTTGDLHVRVLRVPALPR